MARPQSSITNKRNGVVLASLAEDAKGPWQAFKGLMLKSSIPAQYGLVFRPAQGIQTCFMRFPIDLIYFDKQNRVKAIHPAVKPWRFDFVRAAGVVEMNPGSAAAADLQIGDELEFSAPI